MPFSFRVTNIGNIGRTIYLWHRVGKELKLYKDSSFYPYFYQEDSQGQFKTIDNKRVKKIVCRQPFDVKTKRNETSYEADILFYKRYCIDKISQFLPTELKYSFMDIEILCNELPTYRNPIYPVSSISCSDSYIGEIKTFYLKDYVVPETGGDKLDYEETEKVLLNNFVKWVKEQQFDFLAAWNMLNFDWLYLRARYYKVFGVELADILSPINASKHIGGKDEPILVPIGLSIVDYLDFYKKIYKGKQSYALDDVAQDELGETSYEKIDFSILSDKIKEKNINDVLRMIKIEKKKKIINYYDEIRRMSKADWNDLTWNSKVLDMMILSEASAKRIVLPSKKYGLDIELEETFEGAYRRCNIEDKEGKTIERMTGLHKDIWKMDIGSAYPQMIINFCLDTANIREKEGTEVDGIKFYQNPSALLPSLAKKLINKKEELKKQLKSLNPESPEAKDLQIKYDATKSMVNSLFGVTALKIFRLFDIRIASRITYLVRKLLHYIEGKLKERGIKVIYVDTDSFFLDGKDDPKDLLNSLVQQWVKEEFGKEKIDIEFETEGIFRKLLIVALCHYDGDLETKSGTKREIKGIESKRKDSSDFIRKFQTNLIDKIKNEESQETIASFITSQKEAIKKEHLTNIGFPCRINAEKSYKSIPIFMRGLEYTKELTKFDKVAGDSFYWIPVIPFGKSNRKSSRNKTNKTTGVKELQTSNKEINKDVLCFDKDNFEHIIKTGINWDKVIERSIIGKSEAIFDAMDWNKELIGIAPKKERKKKGYKWIK